MDDCKETVSFRHNTDTDKQTYELMKTMVTCRGPGKVYVRWGPNVEKVMDVGIHP